MVKFNMVNLNLLARQLLEHSATNYHNFINSKKIILLKGGENGTIRAFEKNFNIKDVKNH
jgi:hypothetical protein